jgi:hypothetical protein
MMRRHRFLTLLFLLSFFSLSAQNISGLWQGVTSVTNLNGYFICTMTLQQNGSNVTGTALTKSTLSGSYAIQSVAGSVNNNVFNFSDQANGDNVNDKLAIYPSACVKRIKRFAVFNRWGSLIVSKNDILTFPNQEIEIWDGIINGHIMENDTFVYFVEAEYVNGESEILGGDFTILK